MIVDFLLAKNWDVARAVQAYGASLAEIQAAIRYYDRHRDLIDAKLLLEEEESNAWHG